MSKYIINLKSEVSQALMMYAQYKNMPVEQLIEEILNKYVVNEHNINKEDMEKGYTTCGELNLQIANITNDLSKK